MRAQIEARFAYLYKGEGFALINFVFISALIHFMFPALHLYGLFSFWISFFLLEFILLQATMYWKAKLKRLREEKKSTTPLYIVRRLKRMKKWNVAVIMIAPFLFAVDVWRWYPDLPAGGLWIAGGIYAFAVLEYINYFHRQLSYDNRSDLSHLWRTKRFKKACMRKDFERLL